MRSVSTTAKSVLSGRHPQHLPNSLSCIILYSEPVISQHLFLAERLFCSEARFFAFCLCVKTALRAKPFKRICVLPTNSFPCKSDPISNKSFRARTRFETEAQGNLDSLLRCGQTFSRSAFSRAFSLIRRLARICLFHGGSRLSNSPFTDWPLFSRCTPSIT